MKIPINLSLILCSLLHFQGLQGMFINNPPAKERACIKSVEDTIPPVAYCITGAMTVSLPASGCVLIWAKDLDRGSVDDITPVNKLKFYLNGNRNMANIQICCSDFFAAGACDEYFVNLDMWVEDEQGNHSVCKTTVIIQDDLDVCACQSTGYSIKGYISNGCNKRAEANLKLSGPNNYFRESNGPYIRFYELLNGQYHLCLERNDDPLNGISTADIVKIQRHILGIENLNNYAQVLSADVNNSSTITASDVAEIRKLILGIKSQFTNVPSWIFAPSDSFVNPKHLFHVKDFKNGCWDLNINNSSIDSIKFITIKMGDVNCSANLIGQNKTKSRNEITHYIKYYSSFPDKQLVNSSFYFDKNSDIQGFQFTLKFDPALFEFKTIQSGDVSILDEQISLRDLDEGKIHIAWDKNQMNRNVLLTGKLFSIQWEKKIHTLSGPVLNFDPARIKPLIIDKNLNELDLYLKGSTADIHSDIQILQDHSNNTIYLQYSFENNVNAKCSLIDINGRVLLQKEIALQAGVNREYIQLENFPEKGLYFLTIESGSYSRISKIFILN